MLWRGGEASEMSLRLEHLKDAARYLLSYLHQVTGMDTAETRWILRVSLQEQINIATETWYMATELASSFFSIPTRKEDQKYNLNGENNNIQ